jgi:hypothetical protein
LKNLHLQLQVSFLVKICIKDLNNSYSKGLETLRLPEVYQHGSIIVGSISGSCGLINNKTEKIIETLNGILETGIFRSCKTSRFVRH